MVKLSSLSNNQLKELLRQHELASNGTKSEMVARLSEKLGTDEIEVDSIGHGETNELKQLQEQMNRLQTMMTTLMATMHGSRTPVGEQGIADSPRATESSGLGESERLSTAVIEGQSNVDLTLINHRSGISTTANVHVRDIITVLPDFEPENEYQTSKQFIEKVESLRTAYGWPDKLVLYAIHDKLKGHAKTWLSSQDIFHNWEEFVSAFLLDFPCVTNSADIHIAMTQCVQAKNEQYHDYYYKMLAKGRRGKLDDSAIIRHTINGLSDDSVRKTLNAMRFGKCPELLVALNSFEKSKHIASQNNQFTSREKGNTITDVTYDAGRKIKKVTCFNCHEKGHFSNNCPQPSKRTRCTTCNKMHSKDRACTTDAGNANVRSVQLIERQNFKIVIKSKNQEFSALIDTGSECSLVRESVANRLNDKHEKCQMRITGICGGIRCATEKCSIVADVDGVKMSLSVYLVDDKLLPCDFLLGQDLFVDENIQLTISGGKIRIEQKCEDSQVMMTKITHTTEIATICDSIQDEEIRVSLRQILSENESVFASSLKDIGKTDLVSMNIDLISDEIVAQKPYRIPEPKRKLVAEMINEMLENDIIAPSESSYASPILLVKKKNGSERLCVDFRKLNKITKKENFPLSNIEESLHEAAKYKLFTVLDLNSGYYQICINPESRKYTAFVTTEGLFEFKRMPFGLTNAPINFLRLMAKISERAGKENMLHYMDDILIGANTPEEMCIKLRKVLTVIREAGLTLNISKCEFLKTTISFLGHELTPYGIKPGGPKTNAIANFATPQNVTDIRRFLGLSGYFRKFVPGYSIMSEPLRRLLQKGHEFQWSTEQVTAFNQLKEKLITQPVLTAYRVEAEHEIHTDASSAGLAGVLLQREEADLKPVAYYSRSTSPTEKHFHSYELETLAVVETVERFRYYIYGKKIKIVTDCSAVKTAMTKRELIPRIARWWLKIQDYDLQVEHRQGQRMEHVDALSRMPNEDAVETDVATLRVDKVTIDEEDWLVSMQMQDDALKEIQNKIAENDKDTCQEYINSKGRLFRRVGDDKLWVVPKSLRWHMLHENHDKHGHLGVEKTLEKLKRYAWFPQMRRFVKSYINACVECAYHKQKGGKTEGQCHVYDMEPVPFQTIHLDHVGPFPKTAKRNEHILVIVDAFTKYTMIKAVKSTATKFVLPVLTELISYFGVPQRLITDRGTAFTSKDFEKYCKNNDIQHILTAVRTPRANGHAERTNRTLLSMLTTTITNEKQWDQHLAQLQWSLNTMKGSTTSKTPHELLFCYNPRDALQNKILLALTNATCVNDSEMTKRREDAAERINEQRVKQKLRYDRTRATPTLYQEGDLVLAENDPVATGTSRKLEPKYKGPFIISRVLDRDRYVIEDLPNSKRTTRKYSSVFASDKLKPWCKLPTSIADDNDNDDFKEEDEGVGGVTHN